MADSPPRPPWLYRFVRDRTGQSTTIGVVLLLGITVVGTGAILALGSTAFSSTQQSAQMQRTEHSMTLFDSKVAKVALGGTDAQTMGFSGSGEGQFAVHEGAGWLRIVHHNYTAAEPPDPVQNETIYNGSLGSVVYTNGDREVAYQGGGVWYAQGPNHSVMVSPPEFHYRDATLTLPIINVTGTDSAAGETRARVVSTQQGHRIYPNLTRTPATDHVGAPYNDTASTGYEPYVNPVENGTVSVTVHSRYYSGWETYFETRTDGEVSTDPRNHTATVVLSTIDFGSDFPIAGIGRTVPVTNIKQGHVVDDFNLTLGLGNNYNNMYFSLAASDGGEEFEMYLRGNSGLGKPQPCKKPSSIAGEYLTMEMYYDNGTGNGYHGWSNDSIPADSGPIRFACEAGTPVLYANFTADTNLNFTGIRNEGEFQLAPFDGSHAGAATFDQHSVAGEPVTYHYNTGDQANVSFLTNHYFGLMRPEIRFRINYGQNSNVIEPGLSQGRLIYDHGGGAQYLTFLHVTENGVRVELS